MFDDYGILFVIGMAVTMLAGLIYMLSEAKTVLLSNAWARSTDRLRCCYHCQRTPKPVLRNHRLDFSPAWLCCNSLWPWS